MHPGVFFPPPCIGFPAGVGLLRRFLVRLCFWLLLLSAAALGLFLLFRARYRPILRELAQTQIKNCTSDLANDALTAQLARDSVAYDRIVYFEKDLNGRITAMKTNILEVNRMKTELLSLINQEILSLDTSRIGIPIGSLLFPEFFAGKGFSIPVHVLAVRNSDASFESRFQQAGINQTLHRLVMEISVDVSILVLGQTESFSVSSQVVVAETVIVGEVPDTFLNTGGQYGTERENRGADPAPE